GVRLDEAVQVQIADRTRCETVELEQHAPAAKRIARDSTPVKSLCLERRGPHTDGQSHGYLLAGLRLLNRRPDQVAPLGPRAVVVLHVLVSEQVLQNKPRVT